MVRLIVFLAVALVSGAAQANCLWFEQPTADRVLSILRDTPSVIFGDRIEPRPVPAWGLMDAPEFESWTGGPRQGLVGDDGLAVDIEHVYFQSADGAFLNLGHHVGCPYVFAAPSLPSLPTVEEADRTGALVPAIPDRRFVGLVDLPSLSWYLAESDRKSVTLYSAPSNSAPAHATIRGWTELPTAEMGYEETAALVLERRDGWYRIGIMPGRLPPDVQDERHALSWYDFSSAGTEAWLAPEDAGQFKSYEDLVAENLSYLGDRWDGLLSVEPDTAAGVRRLAPQWRSGNEVDAGVRETRWVGDRLWLRVAVGWPGACEGAATMTIAEGWVPAHTAAGQPVVRYYSRGC